MDPTAAEEAFDLSFRRAMMAEAAFQAMIWSGKYLKKRDTSMRCRM